MKQPEKGKRVFKPPASPPQLFLYSKIKSVYPVATLNQPIKTDRGYRYADIGIEIDGIDKKHIRIDIEYDGFAHKYRRRKDRERDLELLRVGWQTIRVDKKNVGDTLHLIEEAIKQCQ